MAKPIPRLTPVEIMRAAARVPGAVEPVHVLDHRLVTARRREIEAKQAERRARQHAPANQPPMHTGRAAAMIQRARPTTGWYRLKHYRRRDVFLWGRIVDSPLGRLRYMVGREKPSTPFREEVIAGFTTGFTTRRRALTMAAGERQARRLSERTGVSVSHNYSWTDQWNFTIAGRHQYAFGRPPRRSIERQLATLPDPAAPNTLGWRCWTWDAKLRCLVSPHRATPWHSETLTAADYSDCDACRGVSGIHARLLPRDWRLAGWVESGNQEGWPERLDQPTITGIVERFGRAVIGQTGWRSEQAVIRELLAPTPELLADLQAAYPGAIVWLAPKT